jgi:hypothetical protein
MTYAETKENYWKAYGLQQRKLGQIRAVEYLQKMLKETKDGDVTFRLNKTLITYERELGVCNIELAKAKHELHAIA